MAARYGNSVHKNSIGMEACDRNYINITKIVIDHGIEDVINLAKIAYIYTNLSI